MGVKYWTALKKSFHFYIKESSIGGLQYLQSKKYTILERFSWFVLLLLIFFLAIDIVRVLWKDTFSSPLVVTLENSNYPVTRIEFPAVAICDINKISFAKVMEYNKYISNHSSLYSRTILQRLRALGHLYDHEPSDSEYMMIQVMLEKYNVDSNFQYSNQSQYNSFYVMYKLAPSCEDLLEECKWNNTVYECSKIFKTRSTYEGFCCVFNYDKEFKTTIKTRREIIRNLPKPLMVPSTDFAAGLHVKIRNNIEDYFYPIISTVGVTVQIFHPEDYPDIYSGGLLQQLVPVDTESTILLNAHVMETVNYARWVPISDRKCLFGDERETHFGGDYTYSDCLMGCRISSMLALCNCVPFQIPSNHRENKSCSIIDLPCLAKFKDKWRSYYPADFFEDGELEWEKHNSLNCPQCWPRCSATMYKISTASVPIIQDPVDANTTRIHILFGKDRVALYKQDVVTYWYELLAHFGGILGLFTGMSLVSIIELVYVFTIRFTIYLIETYKKSK